MGVRSPSSNLYFKHKDELAVASSDELNALDRSIQQLGEEIKAENDNLRKLTYELSTVSSSLSTEALQSDVIKMRSEMQVLSERLAMIKTGTKKVDAKEKQKVDNEHAVFSKLLKERSSKVRLHLINA